MARASGEISVGWSMMKVGFQSFSSTVSSKYSTCRLARLRVLSWYLASDRPSFFNASSSQVASSTPDPASVYFRIASRMVKRSNGDATSTGWPL
ncbi:hypothetical protein D9M68_701090 [compost metagenome]